MEKFITDERTGLRYELVGDYYLIAGGQTHRHLGTTTSAVYPQAQGQLVLDRKSTRLNSSHL